MNDCDEAVVAYVVHGHRMSPLDFTVESGWRQEDAIRCDLGDSNPRHVESHVKEDDSAEKIKKTKSPPRRSRPARRTPVLFSNRVMEAIERHVAYDEAMKGSEKDEWKLSLKKELESIERNNT